MPIYPEIIDGLVSSTSAEIIPDCFIRIVKPNNPSQYGIIQSTLRFTSTPFITGSGTTAQYNNISIFGSTEPLKHWIHTDARQFTLTTKFYTHSNPKTDVIDRVNWCRALLNPVSIDGSANAFHPPIVLVRIGGWFRSRAVAINVSDDYNMSALTRGAFSAPEFQDREGFFSPSTQNVNGIDTPLAAREPAGSYPVEANVSITFEVTRQVINESNADRSKKKIGAVQPPRYTFMQVFSNQDGNLPEDRQ